MQTISPQAAQALLAQGAVLIDIRSPDEYARERIAGASNVPVAQLAHAQPLHQGAVCIFHCRGGHRTQAQAQRLQALAQGPAHVLDGGLDAWKRAGLPVVQDKSQPLEMQRQVQMAAGTLVLAGTVLGATVSPWFYVVPGFVGSGLMVAGVSGFCGMARVLAKMPWNRRAAL